MPDYTFEALSPYDFECLTRDLLQAEFGVRLESFSHGRDRGIDLRYATDRANRIVVQCKHYARSGWPALRHAVQVELPKIEAVNPQRYFLVTSLPLNPHRKDWICDALGGYCGSTADVLGADDLNNLLGRHPDIERQHYKLWLTSVPILERILHSDVFADQASELEHIRRRISRFVTNASVTRALDILSEHHFCVITGVPGIGKTTLAEMIIIDHLERGFECFRIWDDVGDSRKVYETAKQQLFYYDDFLGRTGLRQPDKNEDERLLRFIRDIVQSNHHRLLLTTRDYILNQARSLLEGLTRGDLEPARCVVGLADYTPQLRAEILYNHLYHSGIPQDYIDALVGSRTYRGIVRHRNYSPRIIEAMTDILNVRAIQPGDYPSAFLANLDDPRRLWQVAYDGHLTPAAQNALLVVATLTDHVRIDDAERAFGAFHQARCERYGQPRTPYDWQRALRELEGTFLTIGPQHGAITVSYHNPSVRDFIENRLRGHAHDAAELIASAVFPDQLTRLQYILEVVPDRAWVLIALSRFLQLFNHVSGVADKVRWNSDRVEWRTRLESPIVRFRALAALARLVPAGASAELVREAKGYLFSYLRTVVPDPTELTNLLEAILEGSIPHTDSTEELYAFGRVRVYDSLETLDISLDGFDALVDFAERYPDEVNVATKARLADQFESFADQELDALDQHDPDVRVSAYDQLAAIAERLGKRLRISRDEILDGIEYWTDEEEDSRFSTRAEGLEMSDDDLDSMFDSLAT